MTKQVAVVFHLHGGSKPQAAQLAAAGLPFDPAAAGFERLAIYVGEREAIFVLEGEDVEWRVDDLVNDFFQPALRERLDEWRKLSDAQTWPAQPIIVWEREAAAVENPATSSEPLGAGGETRPT